MNKEFEKIIEKLEEDFCFCHYDDTDEYHDYMEW